MHNIASSSHCHMCRLEFKMPLPPAKNKRPLACIREIQVHKLWTRVYSQKGLTAMGWGPSNISLACPFQFWYTKDAHVCALMGDMANVPWVHTSNV